MRPEVIDLFRPKPMYRITPTTATRVIYLYETQDRKCFYCARLFFVTTVENNEEIHQVLDYNIDHKIPISRGGKSDFSNLVLSCVPCNTLKSGCTSEEFIVLQEKIKSGKVAQKDVGDYIRYLQLKNRFDAVE